MEKTGKRKRIWGLFAAVAIAVVVFVLWVYHVLSVRPVQSQWHGITETKSSEPLSLLGGKAASWRSDNSKVVTVDKKGFLSFVGKGKAKVYAKYAWREIPFSVRVDDPHVSKSDIYMVMGAREEVFLEGTDFVPDWTVDNDKVVYEDYLIKALDEGDTTLTFLLNGRSFPCKIHIDPPPLKKSYSVKKGNEKTLDLQWPDTLDSVWKSQNPDIAAVRQTSDGHVVIRGVNAGKATLIAFVGTRQYKTTVKVKGKQNFSLEGSDVDLGKSCELSITNYVSGYKVTWENAEPKGEGKAVFTGKARGLTTVKAVIDTGVKKETVTREIMVREKKLNRTNWDGFVGESFDVVMQDGENVQYQYDTSMLSLDGNTFTTLAPGMSSIMVMDNGTTLLCDILVEERGGLAIQQAQSIADTMIARGFIYKNNGCSHSWNNALSDENYQANCAVYVSWVLQEAGCLSPGKLIYYQNGLKGSGVSELENSSLVSMWYPDKKPKDCDLLPGDVCGFQLNGSSGHMAVFAGVSDDGDLLWYSAGRDGTDTRKKGGTFDNIGPRKQNYYNEVQVVIRPLAH